jgi:predicted ATPase with chaperone activity
MLAKILFKLKIIPSPNFRETSATNLTAQFVGQTKERVKAQLNEARGGVLFIDEAYEVYYLVSSYLPELWALREPSPLCCSLARQRLLRGGGNDDSP